MAENSPNGVSYYLVIKASQKMDLAAIRLWENIKVASNGDKIWTKGYTAEQIESAQVNCIPFKELYSGKNGKIFPLNSLLPSGNEPALLWTPIERALPIQFPSLNHNYFGMEEEIEIELVRDDMEHEVVAILTTLTALGQYIETAPAIRLQNLVWTVIDEDQAFILGKPLLPILGEVFWQSHLFLIPAGYNFKLHVLSGVVNDLLNPEDQNFVVWKSDGNCLTINKDDMTALSIASYRLTLQQLEKIKL